MSFFSGDNLSSSEHKRIFEQEIKPDKLKGQEPVLRPKMFMLGGQPGAGKTNVRKAITNQPQFAKALIVDPDDLRTYHPRYLQFVKEDPDSAAGRVHYDASKWAQELREVAVKLKLNIILDTTLGGNPSTSVAQAKHAAKAGYDVEVHVAAVPFEMSQQGVRSRYEDAHETYADDPENNPPPRTVATSKQRESFDKIPVAIEKLADSGAVSRVRIATRGGQSLSDISGKFAVKKDGGKTSTKALKDERTRPWTKQEIDHFESANKKIEDKLQKRAKAQMNPQERRKLQIELDELKNQRVTVVNKKQKIINDSASEYKDWFKTYLEVDLEDL
jgi:predicted ABC-type ATPase